MKKVIFAMAALCFAVSLAFAQGQVVTIKGDIIDNMCLGAHKEGDIADFIKNHSKQCAISPVCQASGYSLYENGIIYTLNEGDSNKAAEFLKQEDSKLQVEVKAEKNKGAISIISIKNQE